MLVLALTLFALVAFIVVSPWLWTWWNDLLDTLMALIPQRIWNWLWKDVHTNEAADVTDQGIRIWLSLSIVLVVGTASCCWRTS